MNSIYRLIDRIWAWIAERTFVRFEFDMSAERLKGIEREQLYFALTSGGLVEWLILSSWCRREGLGPILITNRLGLLFLGKPPLALAVLLRKRSWASVFMGEDTKGPRLVFCRQGERRKLYEPTAVEALLSAVQGHSGTSVLLSPILITWRKYLRGAARHPTEFLFGLSSSPNIIGKIWYLVRKRKDSTVRGMPPFSLIEARPDEGNLLGESGSLQVAKAARRKILVAVNEEMRVMLGPRYVSPTAAKETLIHDAEVQEALDRIAVDEQIDKRKLMLRAYRILTEIVANYSYRFIEVIYVTLTWIFTRVFDGLDVRDEELGRLRETVKQKPIVLVSAHRSHFDYLVVPYVLFLQDIVTPHIAAGINLAFWPVGVLLRRGGAFFIRRSFRGDRLYSLLLRKYIGFLVRNRFNIMFFIEGTRSRTGKLLPPAYGILKMVMEAYRSGCCEDIGLVPVSISYDEVIEQTSYARELAGGHKEREDARALLRSHRIVKRNIGKVYLRLGDAVSLRDAIQTEGTDETRALQKTAFDLCARINRATPITPKSLLATILLSQSGPITLEQVAAIGSKMYEQAITLGNQVATENSPSCRRAVETLLRQFHRSGVVRSIEGALPMAFEVPREKRGMLVFYRNNAIHCFVVPSIAVIAIMMMEKRKSDEAYSGEQLLSSAVAIRSLLKFDFFFAPTARFIDEVCSAIVNLTEDPGWRNRSPGDLLLATQRKQGAPGVDVYRAMLGDLIESYLTVARVLREETPIRVDKKSFLQRIVKDSQALSESLVFPESASVQNYGSALSLFENMGVLALIRDKERSWIEFRDWNDRALSAQKMLEELLSISQI